MIVLKRKRIVFLISSFMMISFIIFINGLVYGETNPKIGKTVILDARSSVSQIGRSN